MAQEEGLRATLPDGRSRDELILAYAAGELSSDDEAMVEELLTAHPELQETVALYWSLRLVLATNPLQRPGSRATARTRAIFDAKPKRARAHAGIRSLARKVVQRAPLVGLAALAILVLAGPLGVTAANGTNPGESLYPVKRSVESLRLTFMLNAGQRAEFNINLAKVRVREINELISRKQFHLIDEPLADYERHVTNAMRGLGAMPGDEPAHSRIVSHLEDELANIRSSLTPIPESSPPQVRANVTQLLHQADVAEAFLEADKELVLHLSAPSEPVPSEPEASAPVEFPSSETPVVETPDVSKASEPAMGILVTDTRGPRQPRPTQAPETATEEVTRVQDTSTPDLPTATEPADTPLPMATLPITATVERTVVPTEVITATATIDVGGTPTTVETPVPSVTPTGEVPTGTPLPTASATADLPTETAVPAMTATEMSPTVVPIATGAPISTETHVAPEGPTTEGQRKTPNPPKTPQ